jgi:hypothetical protein
VKRRAASAALAVVSWAFASRAQPPAEEAVRFRYEAPPACPGLDVFTARVRERTARGREAEPEELARTFTVKLGAAAPGFLGTIEFLDDAGSPVSRRVHGEECDAVVSSLALITALALDASLREEPLLGSEEVSPPRAAPSAPVAGPAPLVVPSAPSPESASRPRPPLLVSARVGGSAAYDSALPAPVWGLLGQLDFRNDWAVRFAAHYSEAELEVETGRAISVRVLGLESSVCPLRPSTGELSLYPCASFDLGSLRARGIESEQLVSTGSKTILWAAVGPELRLAWEPRAAFWLELRAALAFPLVHHTFQLRNPTQNALVIDEMTAQGGLVAGVRFW